jgi:Protein of unknown function (DUF1670)
MGSWPTHKATIIRLYLDGLTTPEIASPTYHSKHSVDRYIEGFEPVRPLDAKQPHEELALLTGLAPRVVAVSGDPRRARPGPTQALASPGGSPWLSATSPPAWWWARNPEQGSRLGFLVRLPLPDGDVVLKAAVRWPRTAKLYCHPADWPQF